MTRPLQADSARSVIKQVRLSPVEAEVFDAQRTVRSFVSDSAYLRTLVREDGQRLGAEDVEDK